MRLSCINNFYGRQIKIILLGLTDNITHINYFPCHKKELNGLDYKSFILQIMSVKYKQSKTLDKSSYLVLYLQKLTKVNVYKIVTKGEIIFISRYININYF